MHSKTVVVVMKKRLNFSKMLVTDYWIGGLWEGRINYIELAELKNEKAFKREIKEDKLSTCVGEFNVI